MTDLVHVAVSHSTLMQTRASRTSFKDISTVHITILHLTSSKVVKLCIIGGLRGSPIYVMLHEVAIAWTDNSSIHKTA